MIPRTGPRLVIAMVALTMVVATSACSTERSNRSSADKVDTLNVAVGEPQPSFSRNFNAFSPASKKSPGAGYIYEPLVRVDATDSNKVKPWLAKSFHYSDGGKTLTFKLRDDVKWSDGKPLTAADVKYTLELPSKVKGLGAAPLPELKSVRTPDKHSAVVHYSKPQLHDLTSYGGGTRLIVPKHLWKQHNPVKWTNRKPVGTGAFTLESFGTQSIKLKVRDEYRRGHFNGVKHVNIKAYGSEEAGQKMLLKNQLTWAGNSWENYKKDFVKQDPKHHQYWAFPPGRPEGLVFNMKKPPTNNVHIRRALYAALDSKHLLKLFENGQHPANPTGLEPQVWGKYMPKSLRGTRHKPDPKKAKSELKASGFQVKHGKFTKSGKSYPLSLTTNADYSNWVAWTPGMRSQWKKNLGLDVAVKKSPTDQYGEHQQNGDFQILHDLLVNWSDIWSSLNGQLSSEYVDPVGEKATANYGRYQDGKVDHFLNRMAKTREQKKLKTNANKIQKIVSDQVPYAPLHSGAGFIEINSTNWTGWPSKNDPDYYPYPGDGGPRATLTVQHLKPNATKKK